MRHPTPGRPRFWRQLTAAAMAAATLVSPTGMLPAGTPSAGGNPSGGAFSWMAGPELPGGGAPTGARPLGNGPAGLPTDSPTMPPTARNSPEPPFSPQPSGGDRATPGFSQPGIPADARYGSSAWSPGYVAPGGPPRRQPVSLPATGPESPVFPWAEGGARVGGAAIAAPSTPQPGRHGAGGSWEPGAGGREPRGVLAPSLPALAPAYSRNAAPGAEAAPPIGPADDYSRGPALAPASNPAPSVPENSPWLGNDIGGEAWAVASSAEDGKNEGEAASPVSDPVVAPRQARHFSRQALDGVSRQAEMHVARGYELADRRMLYAARQELTRALEVIAQALDAHEAEAQHTLALVQGLRALEEAADFQLRTPAADHNLASMTASHQTKVLQEHTGPISPLAAAQLYYSYAQEQLTLAVGQVAAGSAALCALGKLHAELAREPSPFVRNALPQVKVYHQAALLANPNNWEAANELAVFLVRSGNYEEARAWLQHSVSIAPRAESWHNLARVHQMFGETQQAAVAQAEALRLAARGPDGLPAAINSPVDVRWIEPEEFARRPPAMSLDNAPANGANPTSVRKADASQPGAAQPKVQQAEQPAEQRGWNWPWRR